MRLNVGTRTYKWTETKLRDEILQRADLVKGVLMVQSHHGVCALQWEKDQK